MKLYTINGAYPNVDFAFTLTPAEIGAAPAVHGHEQTDVSSLQAALNNKSAASHEHAGYLASVTADETQITGAVEIAGVGLDASASGDLTLSYTPTATGTIGGVRNVNSVRSGRLTAYRTASAAIPAGDRGLLFLAETAR